MSIMSKGDRRRGLRRFIRILGIGMVVAAVTKELRLPREEREWHGTIGPVPYDFRVPTLARVRERVWARDSTKVFVPTLFGVGWTLNIGGIITLLRKAVRS